MPSRDTRGVTRIVACAVYRPALEHLQLARKWPGLRLTYLPSNLHMRPRDLRGILLRRFNYCHRRGERVVCLYGDCFPGLEEFCNRHRAVKVPGCHCYETRLGSERFQHILDETAGSYFLERDLIANFDQYCAEPLELYDAEMRRDCFAHYSKLIYVRQPSDPDLDARAEELAKFLELSLEVRDADYSHLERRLLGLI